MRRYPQKCMYKKVKHIRRGIGTPIGSVYNVSIHSAGKPASIT